MSRIESSLTRLEARLRTIFEGHSARDDLPRKFHNQLLRALVHSMHSGVISILAENDPAMVVLIAPDQYTMVLPAVQAQVLMAHPSELDHLAHQLQITAVQSHLQLDASPILRVVPDPTVEELQVRCEFSQGREGDSLTVELGQSTDGQADARPEKLPRAFLIVNGLYTFSITQAVINIGCDPTNQLVLQNPNVSCQHAQLRYTSGRYVIFNLDSTGGTLVNGVAVSSHVLNPGDVILLAGVPLVYGQDTSPMSGYTQELPADTQPPPLEIL